MEHHSVPFWQLQVCGGLAGVVRGGVVVGGVGGGGFGGKVVERENVAVGGGGWCGAVGGDWWFGGGWDGGVVEQRCDSVFLLQLQPTCLFCFFCSSLAACRDLQLQVRQDYYLVLVHFGAERNVFLYLFILVIWKQDFKKVELDNIQSKYFSYCFEKCVSKYLILKSLVSEKFFYACEFNIHMK